MIVDGCPWCDELGACDFHAIANPEQAVALLTKRLAAEKGGEVLEEYFGALLSGVGILPREVVKAVAKQSISDMVSRFEEESSGELSSVDFRALAGLCLACAVVLDAKEASSKAKKKASNG